MGEERTRAERIRSAIVWIVFFGVLGSFIVSAVHYDKQRILDDQHTFHSDVQKQVVMWQDDIAKLEAQFQNGQPPGDLSPEEFREKIDQLKQYVAEAQAFLEKVDDASTGYTWYSQKHRLTGQWDNIRINFDTTRAELA